MEALLNALREKNIKLFVRDGGLQVEAPKGAMTEQLLEQIKMNKQELIGFIRSAGSGGPEHVPIGRAAVKDRYPLSHTQQRFWVSDHTEHSDQGYIISGAYILKGSLDAAQLEDSFHLLVKRYELLRTVFGKSESGEPYQQVLPFDPAHFRMGYQDFSDRQDPEAESAKRMKEQLERPFRLDALPLIRIGLFRLAADTHHLYFIMHHIVSDGVSLRILMNGLIRGYNDPQAQPALPEPDIQYRDYAAWQQDYLASEKGQALKAFWKQHFEQGIPLLNLPSQRSRPPLKSTRGSMVSLPLPASSMSGMMEFARRKHGSLFHVLFSTVTVLLYRYAYQEEMVIGFPVAGRSRQELEDQVGPYINLLPLKIRVDPLASFSDLFAAHKEKIEQALAHQDYPFDCIVQDTGGNRDGSRSPLFDVMVSLREDGITKPDSMLEIRQLPLEHRRSNFDLTFNFIKNSEGLFLSIEYRTDLFDEAFIRQAGDHFIRLAGLLTEADDLPVASINYLPVALGNKRAHDSAPVAGTVLPLLLAQAARTPDHTALLHGPDALNYRDTYRLARQFAGFLSREYKIVKGDFVVISLPHAADAVWSFLGVLLAGAVYIPVDPGYPKERIDYITNDSNSRLLVDEQFIAGFMKNRERYDASFPSPELNGSDLAYVIYTSGTTGNPKGVLLTHANLYAHATVIREEILPAADGHIGMLNHASYAFDISLFEILVPLLSGGTLVIARRFDLFDPVRQRSILPHVTHVEGVPSLFDQLIQSAAPEHREEVFSSIRHAYIGGDAVLTSHLVMLREHFKNTVVHELYGPTEASIWCTKKTYPARYTDIIEGLNGRNIGIPAAGYEILFLDEALQPVPHWVTGEIYIGGPGVANGYLNQPELTARHFIDHPFAAGRKLYRTGDLGRLLPDGDIEFVGRRDEQIKIRGHRIEMGEIEHVLLSFPQVQEVALVVKTAANGEKQLVAYLIAGPAVSIPELKHFLSQKLPRYMVPAQFMVLDRFPLSANGKVDKKALPEPVDNGQDKPFVPAETEAEHILAETWRDVLRTAQAGTMDDFYNDGGDSIKSIQLVARLKQKGYLLQVEDVLRYPLLKEMARQMRKAGAQADQVEVTGPVALTPVQLYFLDRQSEHLHHFNQSVLLKSSTPLDTTILDQCFKELFRHHDALRMRFRKNGQNWEQYNLAYNEIDHETLYADLRDTENPLAEMAAAGAEVQSGFELGAAPLMKAIHFRLSDGDRLAIVIHHLVVDGVSWRILLEDLFTLYRQLTGGRPAALPAKTDSFQRWASAQKAYAESDKLLAEKDYWEAVGRQDLPDFPGSSTPAGRHPATEERISFTLGTDTSLLLGGAAHRAYNTKIEDVLLAALGWTIRDVLRIEKTCIQLEGHGRSSLFGDVDISRTVGWFTSFYPFILDLENTSSYQTSLVKVKEDLRKVPDKGIGFGMLRYLSRQLMHKPLPAVAFNFLGDFDNSFSGGHAGGFTYAAEYIGSNIHPDNNDSTPLNVSGAIMGGQLSVSLSYDAAVFSGQVMQAFAEAFEGHLTALAGELTTVERTRLTPSDLTFKGLTPEQLTALEAKGVIEDVYPLSPLQQGIYYHWLADPASTVYFEQMSYRVGMPGLDIAHVRVAYDLLVSRHGILRTGFSNDLAAEPLQVVWKHSSGEFLHHVVPDTMDPDHFIDELKRQDRSRGFDPAIPGQIRLQVVALQNDGYEFIWSNHHILTDGWSMTIMVKEFFRLLRALTQGVPAALPPVRPYKTYINWLSRRERQQTLDYWKNYLSGYTTPVDVPFVHPGRSHGYEAARELLNIGNDLYAAMEALCAGSGITVSSFIQAIWGYLLCRYNGTRDAVFGAVVSGRPSELEGVEDMVGLFINTIPVRVQYAADATPASLLKSVGDASIEGYPHHYVSLPEIQSAIDPGLHLVNHILIFENYPVDETIRNESAADGSMTVHTIQAFEQTNYDLNIVVVPSRSSLSVQFKYNSRVFERDDVKRLGAHFETVLRTFVADPDQSLESLDFMSAEERQLLLAAYNDTAQPVAAGQSLVGLFDDRVRSMPEAVAVISAETRLSFAALDLLSERYAVYLTKQGNVKAGDRVMVSLPHDHRLVAVFLALQKAGAICVPVDPEQPQQRKKYIAEDSGSILVIDPAALTLMDAFAAGADPAGLNPVRNNHPAAFIIYTSGSTGAPKGVRIDTVNIMNRLHWMWQTYPYKPGEVCAVKTSISFVDHICELYGPLLQGVSLVLFPRETVMDIPRFVDQLSQSHVSRLLVVPTLLKAMLLYPDLVRERLGGISRWLCSGEELKPHLVREFYGVMPHAHLINIYGTTEVTADVTFYDTYDDWHTAPGTVTRKNVPVGRPIFNAKVYILDPQLRLLPPGMPGEICVGGACVTPGYIHAYGAQEGKYCDDPYNPGGRLYRTGDLGRWLPDGCLAFMGRRDDQVKIRGHRVELNEIEAVLLKYQQIDDVAVITDETASGERKIIAFITAVANVGKAGLNQYLKDLLPAYMIPAQILQVKEMPLNKSGKVDKAALLSLAATDDQLVFKAPKNAVEQQLAAIWEAVLERGPVGSSDNFFDLGGHSIRAIQVLSRINRTFELHLEIKDVLHYPVLEDLAGLISFTVGQQALRPAAATFKEIEL